MEPKKRMPPVGRGRQEDHRSHLQRMIPRPFPNVKGDIPITNLPERILRLEEIVCYLVDENIRLRGGGHYAN